MHKSLTDSKLHRDHLGEDDLALIAVRDRPNELHSDAPRPTIFAVQSPGDPMNGHDVFAK